MAICSFKEWDKNGNIIVKLLQSCTRPSIFNLKNSLLLPRNEKQSLEIHHFYIHQVRSWWNVCIFGESLRWCLCAMLDTWFNRGQVLIWTDSLLCWRCMIWVHVKVMLYSKSTTQVCQGKKTQQTPQEVSWEQDDDYSLSINRLPDRITSKCSYTTNTFISFSSASDIKYMI